MKKIETREAALPLGHYSQAIVSGDLVFVSGVLPIEPGAELDSSRSFKEQAECVLRNAAAILKEAGANLSNVVKATVYVTNIENWKDFDQAYAAAFGEHKPARAVAPVPNLHHGFDVEMELIASVSGN
ncbi:RidA family protein [Roseovarius aestuarii]|uniref:Enamine/imine deaminase n=1 Tax=Roseovarius aestuarii TaxID=475083 RepID=A0A1X7BVQ0_9RHOB|nr:RidA family protein [Roseovarius aestuarii]SMC13560.1 Enamine/imine deaminase [Roseovarius aestuarii]